tara:strand:+ start:374 stop:544 length:171 start_codon:yes stop_codon:yes gene_type:complete
MARHPLFAFLHLNFAANIMMLHRSARALAVHSLHKLAFAISKFANIAEKESAKPCG